MGPPSRTFGGEALAAAARNCGAGAPKPAIVTDAPRPDRDRRGYETTVDDGPRPVVTRDRGLPRGRQRDSGARRRLLRRGLGRRLAAGPGAGLALRAFLRAGGERVRSLHRDIAEAHRVVEPELGRLPAGP